MREPGSIRDSKVEKIRRENKDVMIDLQPNVRSALDAYIPHQNIFEIFTQVTKECIVITLHYFTLNTSNMA